MTTTEQKQTADDLAVDARALALKAMRPGSRAEDAGEAVDALYRALDEMEEERDGAQAGERDAVLELAEVKHLSRALARIDEIVADLERGIRDTREVVEKVRDIIDLAQDYGGPCPVRTGGPLS